MDQTYKENTPNRRKTKDRRDKVTAPSLKHIASGKRKQNRRMTDAQTNYFVDRYSPVLLTLIISIIVMSLSDWLFTLIHIHNGAIEINPLMDMAIKKGRNYFFFIKYTMTAVGLLILCFYKNFFPTKKIIVSIFIIYSVLTMYHISFFLLFK